MERNLNMTQGKPLKLLFSFALPLMFGNIFQQLYTVVDTAIVGKGVGLNALAALGTVDWFNWMLLGLIFGFTQGFSVKMSQKYGEGDYEGLKAVIGQSAALCLIIALVSTALAEIFIPLVLTIMRVKPELTSNAELYSRIILGGLPAVMFYNFCSGTLRAVGDSKTPLLAMIVASVTNIVLDCLAVFVLNWGIAGAAAATLVAQCLAGAICAIKMWKTPHLHFTKKDLKLCATTAKDLLRIGSPIAAKNVIIALGGMVIQSIVNGFSLGFIAGFTATNKLYGLLEIAALSYGYAITTYVGQNFGAGRYDRIRQGVKAGVILSLITSLLISAVMFLFGRPITMLFVSQEDPVMAAAAGDTAFVYLCFMSASLPMLYLLYVYLSALQGISKTIPTMVSGILELGLRVSLAILVAVTGYEIGICGAEVAAWFGAAIFLMISYYHNARKLFPKNEASR